MLFNLLGGGASSFSTYSSWLKLQVRHVVIFFLIVFYGSPYRLTWECLHLIADNMSNPWLIARDLNCILNMELINLILVVLYFKISYFSIICKPWNKGALFERLDWVVCNASELSSPSSTPA